MNRSNFTQQRRDPIWAWPNLLGLDAPIVAVCWQYLFADSLGIFLPWSIHLILALSAWCIYLADRLVDTSRSRAQPFDTHRHRFTARNFKKLSALLALASALNAALILRFLPLNLIITGCGTAALIAVYYLFRLTQLRAHVSLIPREVLCGILFAIGCAIAPYEYAHGMPVPPSFYLIVLLFGLLCSASCILISIWEKESDFASNDFSAVTSHQKAIPHIASALSALAGISLLLSVFVHAKALIAIALAVALLRLSLRFQDHLSALSRRALADAVLLTPLIFLFF